MAAPMSSLASPNRPRHLGRMLVWSAYAATLLVAPMIFTSSKSLTLLSQMGIGIVACLSFNMLLGQGGMLSFGHAVYTGLASFVCIHLLNAIGGGLALPVSLVPIAGGFAGMFFAVILGFVTTRKAGTTFAMITLGVGELVFAMSLMVPEFFGGEGGVNANRVVGRAWWGITFGPQIQLYYLLAIYTFVCTAAMFAFTRTPLGCMLNAVRDNPERVEFIGYSAQQVRYVAFVISGFFAGIAGGMYALNFEIATAEVVGSFRSGSYLFFTFLGGTTIFFGPIIGGVLMVLAGVLLSEFTRAWLLYLGFLFLFMVMHAPGGIASLVMMNLRLAAFGKLGRLWAAYLALGGSALVALLGFAAAVEMVYHLQLNQALDTTLEYLWATIDTTHADSWFGAVFVTLVGVAMFEVSRRQFARQWDHVQGEVEKEIQRREDL